MAVKDKEGRFTYPVRDETGLVRVEASDIEGEKFGLKSDSLDFLQTFEQLLYDK